MIAALLLTAVTAQGVIAVSDAGQQGMLCPVEPFRAYTAAHVLEGGTAAVWLGQFEKQYPLTVVASDKESDLALVQTTEPFPFSYEIAPALPVSGEQMWHAGKDDAADGWYVVPSWFIGMHEKELRLTRVMGHAGMSGGCVLNQQGQAAGVYQGWGIPFLREMSPAGVFEQMVRGTSMYSRARSLVGLKKKEVK